MNKTGHRFNRDDYIPRRFGLKYSPVPQIIIEYSVPSIGKLYHHKIKIPKLTLNSDSTEVIKMIYESHQAYFEHKKVTHSQIAKLIEKLKANLGKSCLINRVDNISEEPYNEKEDNSSTGMKRPNHLYSEEDLNKLSTEELMKKKEEMDELYQKNFISPEDNNFIFDVRKDFDIDKYDAEWDDDCEESN